MGEVSIYTIGYGTRAIDDFIELLEAHEIEYLIDVRSRPYSRYNPDFSKQTLEAHLQERNIRYVFMGDTLGGQPDDESCYLDGRVQYDEVRKRSFYQEGVDRLQSAWQQSLRVALMCSEAKPEMCHRSKLIGATLSELGIDVNHIDEQGKLISQADATLRLTNGQLNLFGDDAQGLTSRKRYRPNNE